MSNITEFTIPQEYFGLIDKTVDHECADKHFCLKIASIAKLPSRFGNFNAVAFYQTADDKEHAGFVKGNVIGKENVLVRMHSECLTGDAIGSLRCDCRDQLEGALRNIEEEGEGILLYLRQEGRGIGLTNKLRAYALQDTGLDTVEANLALGLPDDSRDYHLASHMIQALGVKSIRLMTNNPEKLRQLETHGVKITERVKHSFKPNNHNKFYLQTKNQKSGHLIELDV
ncbi:MAG: GTP cyclohydrolase II [Candidatus Hodarchaeales archaeon]|jgi:GTP cyclohydrolase II